MRNSILIILKKCLLYNKSMFFIISFNNEIMVKV